MGWESFGVVRFGLGPLLQGQTRIAKHKVLITRLLLILEVWNGKPISDLTLDPSIMVKRG